MTTFPQCVHGVYDEEMEKIQGKYSPNYGIRKMPREHITCMMEKVESLLVFLLSV